MTSYLDIQNRVVNHCNKGTSSGLYSEVKSAILETIHWAEMNYDLKYMERFVSFNLDPTAEEPRAISFPSNPKKVIFLRQVIIGSDGTRDYRRVPRVDPQDVSGINYGSPNGYWLDGVQFIWFDSIVEEIEDYEMSYYRYSGPLLDTEEHWLFDYCQNFVIAGSIIRLAPFLREAKLAADYKPLFDLGIDVMLRANDEMAYSDDDNQMNYGTVY